MNHSGSDQREDPGMDRDDSNSGSGFAFCNPDETLLEIDVRLLQMQYLSNAHACVKQDQYSINIRNIDMTP